MMNDEERLAHNTRMRKYYHNKLKNDDDLLTKRRERAKDFQRRRKERLDFLEQAYAEMSAVMTQHKLPIPTM